MAARAEKTERCGFRLASFIPYRIVALGHRISGALSAAYEGEGVTIPEWRVLAVVSQRDEMAARDVAQQTPMDKMAVSRAVVLLEAKGLVVRVPDAKDRRVYSLSLSAKGRTLFDRILKSALEFERELLAPFSAAEQAAFRSVLERLEDGVKERA
jgi:DNA-binding MarR family transcriptional regulator